MARPRKKVTDRKVTITIRLPARQVEKLRKIRYYNRLIEDLIDNYFGKN